MSKQKTPPLPDTNSEIIEAVKPDVVIKSPTETELEQFQKQIELQNRKRSILEDFIKDIMVEGVDYGKVKIKGKDGTMYESKPTLFKPGAEKLANFGKLRPSFRKDEETCSMLTLNDTIFYICELINSSGVVVGEGRGACSFNEKSNWNVVVKIAEKRAQTDAVLRVFALSDIFTQDLEDLPDAADRIESSSQSAQSPKQKSNSSEPFDPSKEVVRFGKYKPNKDKQYRWVDLPEEYLKWLSQNSENKTISEKANHTLIFVHGHLTEHEKQQILNAESEQITPDDILPGEGSDELPF